MNIYIAIFSALLPAILLGYYIWKKDPQKEPTSRLVKAFIWGVVICIPVAALEVGIESLLFGVGGQPSNLAESAAMAFLVAALPEEAFKLLALWLVLRKNPYFDEHFDGIVYAVFVGLGFAAIENVFYVLGEGEQWYSVAIARALLAVPGHYAFAILMGFYYSIYHFMGHSPKIAVCVLLVPVVAHGIYDTIAMISAINPYIAGLGFLVLVYFCVKMHKVAKKKVLTLIDIDRQLNET